MTTTDPSLAQDALSAMDRGDFDTAYAVWVKLAEAGDDKAALQAGLMHHAGQGRPVDHQEAYTWYLKAFDHNADAWNNLGVLYRDGLGVKQNRQIAFLLFLTIHMGSHGDEGTQLRANRNLRREIAELPEQVRQTALCHTPDYLVAYVKSRGQLQGIPEAYRAGPGRKRFRELGWWAPGELAPFDCPEGT